MVKNRRRFFIDTHEVTVVKRRRISIMACCADRKCQVRMPPPTEAAFLECRDTKEVFSFMDTQNANYSYLDNGDSVVCLKSLSLVNEIKDR